MTETLYRTDSPSTLATPAEFYELSLRRVLSVGVVEYNVTERHGWWDDNTKRLVNEVVTLNAESGEGYTSYDIALKRYSDQKQHRAQEGFVHLFRREIPSGQEVYVRLTGA